MSKKLTKEEYISLDQILISLSKEKEAENFQFPVNYKELKLIDYPTIIKKPMDLGTIKEKLQEGKYKSSKSCLDDI